MKRPRLVFWDERKVNIYPKKQVEWQINEGALSNCKSMLSVYAPLYCWFVDPTVKGDLAKGRR